MAPSKLDVHGLLASWCWCLLSIDLELVTLETTIPGMGGGGGGYSPIFGIGGCAAG